MSTDLKKGGLLMIGRMLLVVIIALFTWVPPVLAEIPTMNLKYANYMPEAWRVSKVDKYFAQQMLERTNGKVKIQLFHGQTLGAVKEMPKLVGSGAVDIGNFPASSVVSSFPLTNILDMPLLLRDAASMGEFYRKIVNHPLVQEEEKRNNVYSFLHMGLEPYRLIAKKPLKTLADLRGVKVRTFGGLVTDVMSSLGMTAIVVQAPETYEALQRGNIDAVCFNYAALAMLRLDEVAKEASDINFGAIAKYATYVNLKLWNSWPQEMKDIFNQVAAKTVAFAYKDQAEYEAESLSYLQSKGVTVHKFQDQDKLVGKAGDLIEASVRVAIKYGANAKDARVIGDFARQELKNW